ncbi:MAG: glycosyltransferase family 2 protein [Luteibaculum sp.]
MLSIIVPVYYEGAQVEKPFVTITKLMDDEKIDFELIFVDDGSGDDSFNYLCQLAERDSRVKVLKLLSNSGSHMAIRAGLEHSSGNMGVFLSCDLQEPAELIPELLKKLKGKTDIVLAVRKSRDDSFFDRIMSRIFFEMMKKFVSSKIPESGSSMYLLGARALKALKEYPERNLTLEGVFILNNFVYETVLYDRKAREHGKSRWTISKKLKIFVDFFVAYSYAPIRFVTVIGILFFALGFLWSVYLVIRYFTVNDFVDGWPMLISILCLGFGITNISLGIIAEYLWRTLDEGRRRPKYIIEKRINF